MIDKRVQNLAAAVAGIKDGSVVLCAGFGGAGLPDALCEAVIEQGARDLTVVANNAGTGRTGLAALMAAGRVRKIICSFPRSSGSVVFEELYAAGKIELELVPQGTLSERMRCAAAGLGGFYSPVSVGTRLAEGKEHREIDGRMLCPGKALEGRCRAARRRSRRPLGQSHLSQVRSATSTRRWRWPPTSSIAQVRQIVELGELDPR